MRNCFSRTESDEEPFDDYYDEVTINEGLKNGTMFKVKILFNILNILLLLDYTTVHLKSFFLTLR